MVAVAIYSADPALRLRLEQLLRGGAPKALKIVIGERPLT